MGRRPGGKNRPRASFSLSDVDEMVQRHKEAKAETAHQTSAFPTSETREATPATKISGDAKNKKEILEAAGEIPDIFTKENVKWVFDLYVALLCFAYSIALKAEFSALQDELSFDEEQKDSLAVPLAKICSKYAPSEWAGMAAEIQLVTMMGVWTVASFQRARNVAKAQEEKKRDAERTQPVQPIRQNRSEVHVPA
jgi:hypothetical protein